MLKKGIFKNVFQSLDAMVTGRGRISEELFDDMEEALLAADVSLKTTERILADVAR